MEPVVFFPNLCSHPLIVADRCVPGRSSVISSHSHNILICLTVNELANGPFHLGPVLVAVGTFSLVKVILLPELVQALAFSARRTALCRRGRPRAAADTARFLAVAAPTILIDQLRLCEPCGAFDFRVARFVLGWDVCNRFFKARLIFACHTRA